MEAGLFNLRARRHPHPPVNCTHAQKARNANVENEQEEEAAAEKPQQSHIEEVPDEDANQPSKETPQASSSTFTQLINMPEIYSD